MSTAASYANIYLTHEDGKLVLREGTNPNTGSLAEKHVLIIGGGVTGLTVNDALSTN